MVYLNRENAGTLLAFIAAIISGFAIFANKIFIVDLDPLVFTAVRAIIIGALFFIISLFNFGFEYVEHESLLFFTWHAVS